MAEQRGDGAGDACEALLGHRGVRLPPLPTPPRRAGRLPGLPLPPPRALPSSASWPWSSWSSSSSLPLPWVPRSTVCRGDPGAAAGLGVEHGQVGDGGVARTVRHDAGTVTGKSAVPRQERGTSDPPADADDGAAPNSRPPWPPSSRGGRAWRRPASTRCKGRRRRAGASRSRPPAASRRRACRRRQMSRRSTTARSSCPRAREASSRAAAGSSTRAPRARPGAAPRPGSRSCSWPLESPSSSSSSSSSSSTPSSSPGSPLEETSAATPAPARGACAARRAPAMRASPPPSWLHDPLLHRLLAAEAAEATALSPSPALAGSFFFFLPRRLRRPKTPFFFFFFFSPSSSSDAAGPAMEAVATVPEASVVLELAISST